jgi:pimeloyl-ACP methyl ester carboxylesterase
MFADETSRRLKLAARVVGAAQRCVAFGGLRHFGIRIFDAWAGQLAYDPGLIRAPVAIIRGEWDNYSTDADAHWLFGALKASPEKRDIKVSRGTHLMHLERMRGALHCESIAFLAEPARAVQAAA